MGGAAQQADEVLVDPDEDVCRLCFSAQIPISIHGGHPNQVDPETGLLRLEEISWQDVKRRGFSLQRRHLYSYEKAIAEAARRDDARRVKGQDAQYILAGVLIAAAARITSIHDETGVQVFRVLQTPSAEQPGHAEIRVADNLEKHNFLEFRESLQIALGPIQDATLLDVHDASEPDAAP